MKCRLLVGAVLAALTASAALAEDGIPSQAKLNQLGLSSLQVAGDSHGEQVRGKAFVKMVFRWHTAAGEKATVNFPAPNNLTVTIDPLSFIANDTNSGAGIASDGIPLFGGPAAAQQAQIAANSAHQQDVLLNSPAGNLQFSEISSSLTNATVFAGTVP